MAAHSPRLDFSGTGLQSSGNINVGHDLNIGSSNDNCLAALRLTDPRHDKKRIESAKGGLLRDSYVWILGHDDFQRWKDDRDSHLLWIKGDPGKGKTMLLCGIIDEMNNYSADRTHLLSFFFCQATDERLNNATGVLRGLIYLLIDQHTELKSYVEKRYEHAGKSLFKDVNAWVALSDIFADVIQHPKLPDIVLIIDALDECEAGLHELLDLIIATSSTPNVKWLLSSRNKIEIEEKLMPDESRTRLSLELRGNAAHVSHAVGTYIKHCISNIPAIQKNANLRDFVRDEMRRKADGTFLWVGLVAQELKKARAFQIKTIINAVPTGLSKLYSRMMRQIQELEYNSPAYCQQVLSAVTTTYRPLHLQELAALSGLSEDEFGIEDLVDVVKLCGSFLTIQEDRIFIIHQSAQDFLHQQAKTGIFPDGAGTAHYDIFSRSLRIMSKTLQQNIYDLDDWGISSSEIRPPRRDPLTVTRYSCIHWFDHLETYQSMKRDVCNDLQDNGILDIFLRHHYLHWLESLSILKEVSKGISVMHSLSLLLRSTSRRLHEFISDANQFIRRNRLAIESHPLQVYGSALVFSPSQSLLRQRLQTQMPQWMSTVKLRMGDTWGVCLSKFENDEELFHSVAFSPNGNWLAVGALKTRIMDITTGKCIATFVGARDSDKTIGLVAFSPDGTILATDMGGVQIMLWDIATGEGTLLGDHDRVSSIAFSHDGKHLASVSDNPDRSHHDNAVKMWDLSTRKCSKKFGTHVPESHSLAFSPNGSQLASSFEDGTIRLWDIVTSACTTIEGFTKSATSIAFSPGRRQLASGYHGGEIKLWDLATGKCTATGKHAALGYLYNRILSLSFSPNGSQLASGSWDSRIKIWDTTTMECLSTLKAHRDGITEVAFSPDGSRLASGSGDGTAKVWDMASIKNLSTHKDHSSKVHCIAFSLDGSYVASGSYDGEIKVWDATTGACLKTHWIKEEWGIFEIALSPNGSRLAAELDNSWVVVLEVETGNCIKRIDVKEHSSHIAFSSDGRKLGLKSYRSPGRVIDISTGQWTVLPENNEYFPERSSREFPKISFGWLEYDCKSLLLIPSKFEPTCWTSTAQSIAVGCKSGRVWMLTLDTDSLKAIEKEK
ncbi:WD40-repeat-containing domain protein [Annulohypoxylon nitens]|nr:WD40-repeat-containing domain protein [Annulohypoxylon nitens]